MKLGTQDIYRLRWSIALFVALAAAGTGIGIAAIKGLRQAEQNHRQAVAQRSDIQARLARARDEEREIRNRIARYHDLTERGIIGQEQRLDWVEAIAHIKAARRLLDVQYELAPQRPIDASVLPGGSGAGGHEFMASTMKLQMKLLHEDDLLGFLADLRSGVQAILLVRQCNVERLTRNPADRSIQPQLQAECLIEWVTLREAKP